MRILKPHPCRRPRRHPALPLNSASPVRVQGFTRGHGLSGAGAAVVGFLARRGRARAGQQTTIEPRPGIPSGGGGAWLRRGGAAMPARHEVGGPRLVEVHGGRACRDFTSPALGDGAHPKNAPRRGCRSQANLCRRPLHGRVWDLGSAVAISAPVRRRRPYLRGRGCTSGQAIRQGAGLGVSWRPGHGGAGQSHARHDSGDAPGGRAAALHPISWGWA